MTDVIVRKHASPTGSALLQIATALALVLCFTWAADAGGPEYVAGSSFFNASTMGQPLTWSLGQVNYYTDQGDLSPILPNSAANAFVANAFLQWTSVSIASVTANAAGQLAEDVNGSNIAVNESGVVTAPADITPSATQTPVGIVYDDDGSVTDALLGAGAGDPSQCFWNAVYGGVDNYDADANFLHALVVINGQCALQSSQLTDVEYRLVRVLGSVFGLGWSQLNVNVVTGDPHATPDDLAGFPVMHYMDSVNCVPVTICYPNPYQLAPDDAASLSRLYPAVTSSTLATTARIHGSVYFANHFGSPGQPMQGVNVFARWIDPSTNLPSHQYAASSVSGFLFTGNAGNPITGLTDPLGNAYSQFGSNDQSLEGFFDLGGLPIPSGASTAQYQLSVEALDPTWSAGVCPYDFSQVAPSGAFAPIIVTVNAGGDFDQDILMSGSAQAFPPWAAAETWSAPAQVPSAGDWVGSLSGYGDIGYFLLTAQANRTLSVEVTALDEASLPSESKAAPVVGMWALGDPQGTVPPVFTAAPFNSETFGMSLLNAQVLSPSSFIIGIADLRGDGRPDYAYHAHVLYGDSVVPPRVPVSGGAITLQGTGFTPGLAVTVGSANVPLLATNASQILVAAPAQSDGPQTITITDPVSGAASAMTGALTFGAASTDKILLLQGANTLTPVGIQATNPVMVRVVASDGITPVSGATVGWTTTNGATLAACGGATSCSAITDESGMASTGVTPAAAGGATITATLAPGVYNPAQSVVGDVVATSSSLAIGVSTPYLWVAQGASLSVSITARVLSSGAPQSGATVKFTVAQGSGSLSASTALTNSSGYASVTLTLTNFTANVQLSICVPAGNPTACQTVYGSAVSPSLWNLQAVSGANQVVSGQGFQPLTVRVTDSSTPPNSVLGASVLFQSMMMRPAADDLALTGGDPTAPATGSLIILGASQGSVQSDANGLASYTPSMGSLTAPLAVETQVSAGASAAMMAMMESFPPISGGDTSVTTSSEGSGSVTATPVAPWHMPIALPVHLMEY
ncbi:MAG: IPT/TIG domain-containing protein [Candidatus Sulfotelmatobacter sp.]